VEISVRDIATGKVVRTGRVKDPFGGSSVMLFAHPGDREVVAWVAAGQDGQTAYLLTETDSTIEGTELARRNCLPPVFLPDGRSYVSAGDAQLEHYSWPSGELLGTATWPTNDMHEEDPPGSDLQILPGGFASWSSTNGRLYVVDLAAMQIVDELTISGHPLRTVDEVWNSPRLRGDLTPCTDFGYAEAGPDGLILTVHARTQLVTTKQWSPTPERAYR
jgi:hypothetical protein